MPHLPREDSFELHLVDLELEAVEKQIRDLQVKQAQLRQRKAALESSRTDAHLSQAQRKDAARPGFVHSGAGVPRSLDAAAAEDASQAPGEDLSPSAATRLRDPDPEPLRSPSRDGVRHVIIGDSIVRHVRATGLKVPAILKKNIGAVVLHAGTNDIRLRQTEILKKDFRSLVELVRTTSPTTRIIVSGPLPTFQRGIERFSRLFAFNEWLQSWCQDQKLPFVDTGIFSGSVLGSTVLMACTQAELEQQSSQTTSPGHYAPSD
ncbi:hypothetical protein QTP70_033020 [Hemibagrus guttatus]|uniref:SGNH hydrolase-type esterase domain-containing protein n=1 Tax=Hemibagrus guttatus TaxID=175788 RepID=A0AAE0QCE2_9TELE|nr:hypothetical protein QTP70_033020 [Hemibagrus guttatus]